LTEGVIGQLVDAQDQWPLKLVREVCVFGSFARGALQPGDVDLYVDFDGKDERWTSTWLEALSYGYDPRRVFRQALVGRKRGVQFVFERPDIAETEMILLWGRGDDLPTALARLHAIKEDPLAGRAERDAMLPQFEGMDHWLPLYCREGLIAAVGSGALRVERLVLEDRDISDSLALEHMDERWPPTSPLYRAARSVFAYLFDRGVDPAEVHLHGREVHSPVTPFFAGFQLRYFRAVHRCLTEFQGREWIEVVHPTRRGEVLALRLLPGSPEKLEALDWLPG
jgi:hypothetical protein